MNDPVPVHDNRLAVIIGRVLDPFLLPIPTLLVILSGLPVGEALVWFVLVITMILIPGFISTALMERYVNPVYKRRTRGPLYLIAWISVLVCLAVVLRLQAPPVLVASVATLAVWVPLQWAVNTWVTKISAHAAVAAGCVTTLIVMGKAGTPVIQITLLALVVITLWARVITHHHTIPQVILGLLVGVLPVLVVFPLILA